MDRRRKTLKLGAAMFQFDNPKAVVAMTSLDDEPLSKSRYILITAIAHACSRLLPISCRTCLSQSLAPSLSRPKSAVSNCWRWGPMARSWND